MSRVLLSGFRLRIADENFDSPGSSLPYRLNFFDSSTSSPKLVYSGPDVGDSSLGSSVNLDSEGYVPVSGVWLDVGRYNIELQRGLVPSPSLPGDWETLFTINKVQGGTEDSELTNSTIRFVDTIADIRGLSGDELGGLTINTGYYNLSDGGQGQFRWNSTSLLIDDGGAYLKPTGQSEAVPGRWHRVFETDHEVSVCLWGAISDQSDVSGNIEACKNWCSRSSDDTAQTILFPSGLYKIGGSIILDGSGINIDASSILIHYHITNNARFTSDSVGVSVTFSNPTTIDTRTPLCTPTLSVSFDSGSITHIRPEWLPTTFGASYADRVGTASNYGVPVWIDVGGNIEWDGDENSIVNSPVVIFPGTRIAPPVASIITFRNTINVLEENDPVFCKKIGLNFYPPDGEVYIESNCVVRMNWFGWDHYEPSDQSPVVQYAFDSALSSVNIYDTPTFLFTKTNDYSKYIASSVSTGSRVLKIDTEAPIRIESGGSLSKISLVDESMKWNFDIDGSGILEIDNGCIYPDWFGIQTKTTYTDRTSCLINILKTAALNGVTLDGLDKEYTINSTLNIVLSSDKTLSIKRLNLTTPSETETFTGTYSISFSGPDSSKLIIENSFFGIGTEHYLTLDCLYSTVYDQKIINSNFINGIYIDAANLIFTGNHQEHSTTAGSEVAFVTNSLGSGQVIANNKFIESNVYLDGETTVKTGNEFRQIKCVKVESNIFQSNGVEKNGCLTLRCNGVDTLVAGVTVTNNTFSGYVFDAVDDDAGKLKRRRIREEINSGNWYDPPTTPTPVTKAKSTMLINNNIHTKWFSDTTQPIAEVREQYIPSTICTSIIQDLDTKIASFSFDTINVVIDVKYNLLDLFVLTGDTNSNVEISLPNGSFYEYWFNSVWYKEPLPIYIRGDGIFEIGDLLTDQAINCLRLPMHQSINNLDNDSGTSNLKVKFEIYSLKDL